ncbi:MAG: TrbI/VirB10 family protein [Sphingomonas sp.]|nr:TrbI/VirB10 family protein [Sphingomonas sp.]
MSEAESPTSPPPPKEDPETLVLRGRPRPALRFRRGLIVGLTGAAAASLVALSWVALEPPTFRKSASTVDSSAEPAARTVPDALNGLPKTYGDVPRLGPPLPGDLGRPILEHERSLGGSGVEEPSDRRSAAELAHQRAAEEREAARRATLMVQLAGGGPQEAKPLPAAAEASVPSSEAGPVPVPASQEHKIDFVLSGAGALNPHELKRPVSPWVLSAGSVIPASLLTALNSDLPGMVLAQVTEDVRDSASGQWVLVPQGARLVGNYDSIVAFGQRRALVIWNRIVLPDGSSVELDHMPATDASGYSGVADRVDRHTWQLLEGIGLSTLLGVGTELSLGGSGSDLVRALRRAAQESGAHVGDQITSRDLDIQPTITVRPGWPIRAVVNKDLVLSPWRQ